MSRSPFLITISAIIINLLTLSIFGALSTHALRHVHDHSVVETTSPGLLDISTDTQGSIFQNRTRLLSGIRYMGQALLALAISLGGVIVMVESGQDFAVKVNLPQVILGLIILAVATSLPNTVVAFSLARTHRAVTCIEEVFSSNSINAALGIALPLLLWSGPQHDPWLLWLDTPLMATLTAIALLCVLRQRISRPVAVLLLLVYVVWVVVHIL
jgi:Ca2+/Na+ antiporter